MGFILALAACSMTVFAQSDQAVNEDPVLEEIIVTATKRAVSLQDLPLSVGVVTGDEIGGHRCSEHG